MDFIGKENKINILKDTIKIIILIQIMLQMYKKQNLNKCKNYKKNILKSQN